jgi:hypothetical protein
MMGIYHAVKGPGWLRHSQSSPLTASSFLTRFFSQFTQGYAQKSITSMKRNLPIVTLALLELLLVAL